MLRVKGFLNFIVINGCNIRYYHHDMAMIRKLEGSEASKLVSQVSISSYTLAVKELIKNAIQAHATKVSIVLDWKSLSFLIQDDGVGISAEDLADILVTHNAEYYSGNSLQALNCVGRLSIVSKVYNQETNILKNNHVDKYIDNSHLARNLFQIESIPVSGTVVTVINLFDNVPPRRNSILAIPYFKQLEEMRTMLVYSMTNYPNVVLNIAEIDAGSNSISSLINLPPKRSYHDLLKMIFGDTFISDCESINASSNDYTMEGVLGKSHLQPKGIQVILFNSEPFYLSSIQKRQLIKLFAVTNSFPIYILSIKSSNETRDEERIFKLICKSIISYLSSQNQTVTLKSIPQAVSRTLSPKKLSPKQVSKHLSKPTSPVFKKQPLNLFPKLNNDIGNLQICKKDLLEGKLQIINQIDKKFILIRLNINRRSNLIIVDQHACDERIQVEKLFQQYLSGELTSIDLQIPMEINITGFESQLFIQYQDNLRLIGITFSLSNNSINIVSLPPVLFEKLKNIDQVKLDMVEYLYDLLNNRKSKISKSSWTRNIHHLPKFIIDAINSKSCQSAIKFGDVLTKTQMEDMISKLKNCHLPFQCAHGRPTMIPLTNLK